MGVDAQLYAAAAASRSQFPRTRQQSDAVTVMDKPVTVRGTAVTTDVMTQNDVKSGSQHEGVYITY